MTAARDLHSVDELLHILCMILRRHEQDIFRINHDDIFNPDERNESIAIGDHDST